jgi:RNA polymerase sigma factor (sigma-70 family)
MAVVRAFESYVPDGTALFVTYASKFIFGAILRFVQRDFESPSRPGFDGVDELDDGVDDPEDLLAVRRDVTALRRALPALSEVERQIVSLRFGDELEWLEIADVVGMPRMTAYEYLRRALEKLRAEMGR